MIDPTGLDRGLWHTIEEHRLDELEPILARFAPREISAFYRRLLQTASDVDSLTWLAFQLPSSEKVDGVRERILDEACTDEHLFQIALAAQATGASSWLAQAIREDLAVPGVHRPARALMLIGFLDDGPVLDAFRHQLTGCEGFLEEVATCARNRLEANRRARACFRQFLARRDPVEAWAAFRLFLCCVDRRFYLWVDPARNVTPDLPLLWRQQLSINDHDIRRAAKENEGRLSECILRAADIIEYQELIIDVGCMKLVQDPTQFDVLLENLYGDVDHLRERGRGRRESRH